MNKSISRELAFKLLYSMEIQQEYGQEQIDLFIENNEIEDKKIIQYIQSTINGILENKKEIQKQIEENLKEKWDIGRISKIDFVVLQIAIYEIQYKKLPYKIAINEAVELAKMYGEDSSKSFVNGMLATIVKKNGENNEVWSNIGNRFE